MEKVQETEVPADGERKRRRLYEPLVEEADEKEDFAEGVLGDDGESQSERYAMALRIINKYVYWSAGVGLIPVPVLDAAALTGVNIKMSVALCELYDVPFSVDRAKSVLAALIGSVGATSMNKGLLGAGAWMIPLIGPALYLLLCPAAAGAVTYAIGRVFVQHYEMGGTLLDFDPDKTKAFFAEQFRLGKEFVAQKVSPKSSAGDHQSE